MNPASNRPPGRNTRAHSRQIGRISAANTLETGLKMRSNDSSPKADKSAMSPWTVSISRPCFAAVSASFSNCTSELSNEVTVAPAAAKIGTCWPPPDASANRSMPERFGNDGNHDSGTGLFGVKITDQSPALAFSKTASSNGVLHRQPSRDCKFQALRLYSTMSIGSVS